LESLSYGGQKKVHVLALFGKSRGQKRRLSIFITHNRVSIFHAPTLPPHIRVLSLNTDSKPRILFSVDVMSSGAGIRQSFSCILTQRRAYPGKLYRMSALLMLPLHYDPRASGRTFNVTSAELRQGLIKGTDLSKCGR
jgi:hypothetical protein